tara:strand:+ start:46 stop:1713 length:1668 start_codon:yes stop_codon:yes gene_type:complete
MESALQITSTSQIIEWDTTKDQVEYPSEINKIYNEEILNNRSNFTKWIDKISKNFNNDIDWWISLPASRNPYVSEIYHLVCVLKTLKFFYKKKIKIKIITGSTELKKILEYKFKDFFKIKLINKKSFLINFKTAFNAILFNFFLFFFIKLFIKKKIIMTKNLVLIDTFAFKSSIKSERLYKGLEKFIRIKKINYLFFIPSFLIEKNIIKIIQIINAFKKRNYLFKEHYLKFSDLFYAIFYFKRVKKFPSKFYPFENFDISSLIYKEIRSNDDYSSKITALLNYRFSLRLKQNKIQIKKVVNWFENQIVDKGFNFGFRKNYPRSEIIGYQGFLFYGQYQNTFPSQEEFKSNVIPKKIYVISKKYVKLKREFCSKLHIKTAPALYFQNFFKTFKKTNKIKILLILSGIVSLDLKLLKWLSFLFEKKNNFNVVIKSHPLLSLNKININFLKKFENRISISDNSMSELLKSTKISISSGPTSGTIESIAYGCYLISPVLEPYDAINLKILKIPKNCYKLVYDKIDFVKQIDLALRRNIKFKRKNNFFLKTNRNNINIFF